MWRGGEVFALTRGLCSVDIAKRLRVFTEGFFCNQVTEKILFLITIFYFFFPY